MSELRGQRTKPSHRPKPKQINKACQPSISTKAVNSDAKQNTGDQKQKKNEQSQAVRSFKEGDINSLLKQVHRLTDQIRQIELNDQLRTKTQKKSPSFGHLPPQNSSTENVDTSFLMSNQELLELQQSFQNDPQKSASTILDNEGRNDIAHDMFITEKGGAKPTEQESEEDYKTEPIRAIEVIPEEKRLDHVLIQQNEAQDFLEKFKKEDEANDFERQTEKTQQILDESNISDDLERDTANQSKDQKQATKHDNSYLAELEFLRQQVTLPYLPPLSEKTKLPKYAKSVDEVYTLVLDLDETLINFKDAQNDHSNTAIYQVRPGAFRFINQLSDYFEIVIFTASMPDYADFIIDDFDAERKVSHRLYRQHTDLKPDYAVKDLTLLGRDLSRTIIIDNLAENFSFTTPNNGLWVRSWYDDLDDDVLNLLIPFLKQIVRHKVDVRQILTAKIKEEIIYKCLAENASIPSIKLLK